MERERDRPTASPTGESAGADDFDLYEQSPAFLEHIFTHPCPKSSQKKEWPGPGPGGRWIAVGSMCISLHLGDWLNLAYVVGGSNICWGSGSGGTNWGGFSETWPGFVCPFENDEICGAIRTRSSAPIGCTCHYFPRVRLAIRATR